MNWRCAYLPWHKLRVIGRPSARVDHIGCSCGREYGMHHELRTVVPWLAVRAHHEEDGYVRPKCA